MTVRLSTLTFAELVAVAPSILRDRPETISLVETRIARALASIRPIVSVGSDSGRAHRCDLSRAWCAQRRLPSELVPRALVCEGVRHALRLLLSPLANGSPVAIPSDVYPVYGAIARETGVVALELATWPVLDLGHVLATASRAGARVVLLPMPLKLHGRTLTKEELDSARAWLAEDGARRLVLDGVYSFGAAIGADILALLETDQVVYLDSMSKGWLHEQVFGVAIVPAREQTPLTDVVRAASPSRANLLAARELLERFPTTPAHVRDEIDRRRTALMTKLAVLAIPHTPCDRGYLVALDVSADALLTEQGVLALPASVFGSASRDRSFASALAMGDAT